MNSFQLTFNQQPITDKEALALLKAAKVQTEETPTIELTKLFSFRKLNTKELFMESVASRNQDLASLAWKLSTNQVEVNNQQRATKTKSRAVPHIIKAEFITPDAVIARVCSHPASWSCGTALILHALSTKFTEATMKQVCTDYVNAAWYNYGLAENSSIFLGYTKNENGCWEPKTSKAGEGDKALYTMSPVYVSVREGMVWAHHHGLIEREEAFSISTSDDKSNARRFSPVQRKYYKIKLTSLGRAVIDTWGDSIEFVNSYFASK